MPRRQRPRRQTLITQGKRLAQPFAPPFHVAMQWLRRYCTPHPRLRPFLQRPLVGYSVAIVLQAIACLINFGLVRAFPTFSFVGIVAFLGLVVTAWLWGAGPALLATLVGAVLIDFVVLYPHFQLDFSNPATMAGIFFFVLTGIAITWLVSEIERERTQTENYARQVNAANQHMHDFLHTISHELKNPLTTIQASVQLLSKRLMAKPETRDERTQMLLESADRQVKRLTHLLNDLVDISRIESGKLALVIEQQNLADIVATEVEQMRLQQPGRVFHLEPLPPEPVWVAVDATRIAQVLNNYLTNACKYAPPDRPITITLKRGRQRVRVVVKDEGPGISEADQALIWERFQRLESTPEQMTGGVSMGLGLHICRTLIAQQHGFVGVESELGHGAAFWFALPLLKATTKRSLPLLTHSA